MTNQTAVSKTAAIREARRHVSAPVRQSPTSYVVYAPYRATQPTGARTELVADSRPKIVARRAEAVARVALALMGRLSDDAEYAIERVLDDIYADHSAEALIAAGLAASGGGK